MQAQLTLGGGARAMQEFETITLGRAADNDVCLAADDAGVSRRHCELRFQDGAFWVHDEGSANGTFVDERGDE